MPAAIVTMPAAIAMIVAVIAPIRMSGCRGESQAAEECGAQKQRFEFHREIPLFIMNPI